MRISLFAVVTDEYQEVSSVFKNVCKNSTIINCVNDVCVLRCVCARCGFGLVDQMKMWLCVCGCVCVCVDVCVCAMCV